MEFVRHELGFSNMFIADSVGQKGGLVMLWHTEDVVEVVNSSKNHIHLKV